MFSFFVVVVVVFIVIVVVFGPVMKTGLQKRQVESTHDGNEKRDRSCRGKQTITPNLMIIIFWWMNMK